jgi:hypothetical protein
MYLLVKAVDGPILKLALVTRAPWDSPQVNASMTQLFSPVNVPLHGTLEIPVRADSTGEPPAIPAVPRSLLITPEMTPATPVP